MNRHSKSGEQVLFIQETGNHDSGVKPGSEKLRVYTKNKLMLAESDSFLRGNLSVLNLPLT